MPRPVAAAAAAADEEPAMTLDKLLASEDRHDAIIFLLELDELMSRIAEQYRGVVRSRDMYRRVGAPDSANIETLLEASVATNMAIQKVQQLEMDLQVQHPHLTNPYRLLSLLVLPELTKNVADTVREHSNNSGGSGSNDKTSCTEQDISIFLGDCLECHFRNNSDPKNRREFIVQDFCTKFGVDAARTAHIETAFQGLHRLFVLEVPVGSEQHDNQWLRDLMKSNAPARDQTAKKSHSWLREDMEFIGGDRAIHHTIHLLQTFGDVVKGTPLNRGVVARPGIFGSSPWRPGRSRTIHNDMDELLMTDILPQWVVMCRRGILSVTQLPQEAELCPLFVHMRDYIQNPDRAVSWSLAFSVHAILTSVIETDRIVNELIATSKTVFKSYFAQLNWARRITNAERAMSPAYQSPVFEQNMAIVEFCENLGLPVFGDRAIWNPLCAGTIFSYLCYFGNLEAGCTLIDCHAQLRIVLHMYHAFLVNNIVRRGELPMLEMLYDSFKSSRGVWEGPPPKKGEFVELFWVCFGLNWTDSKRMAEQAKHTARSRFSNDMNHRDTTKMSSWKRRKMNPVKPAEISTSYCHICNCDFRDLGEDKYHTPEQRQRMKGTEQYLFAIRTNDTLDCIEDEQKLLCFNLPAVGAILDQFLNSLGRIMQWEPAMTSGMGNAILKGNKRQGFLVLFAQHILGAMDFAADPLDHEFLNVPLGRAPSEFMKTFFSRLNPENLVWFQAIAEEE